ncbi:COMM domain-containing protein 1-like [Rhopilema esculentum]|uniref:COMM domain-containing protein 1-like n=1 Tax=Rhopilema esculentum TaxID=499914 RepID=UPI0031E28DB1|eukprot:gene3376-1726_t
MAGVDKSLLGLLNGIAKREYYGEEGIGDDFLHEGLFPDLDESSFIAYLKRFDGLVKTMANSDMDFRQLEAFLTSQMKRREGALSEEQAAAVTKFWKNHKGKIHDVVTSQSTFGNKLQQTNWRIDLKAHSRYLEQINTPVAIYELEFENKSSQNGLGKVRFEMDADQLNEILCKVEKIKEKIRDFSKE